MDVISGTLHFAGNLVIEDFQSPGYRQYVTYHLPAMDSFFYREGTKGARAGRMLDRYTSRVCGFSLVVRGEGDVNYSPLVVHYSNHHRLLAVLLMPGCNFVVTGRQLQLE